MNNKNKITVSKEEYQKLKDSANKYADTNKKDNCSNDSINRIERA